MSQPLRFNRVNIEHPTERERQNGSESQAFITLITPGGQLRQAPLTVEELAALIEQASNHLYTILRRRA